jgi:D-proline reductase (dithiol) PrdB
LEVDFCGKNFKLSGMGPSRLKNRLLARLFTAFPALASTWGNKLAMDPDEIPWTEPVKPLRDATLALVTTGGIHLKSQQPFDMSDPDGDPTFRELPVDAPAGDLVITHDYYDHRDAEHDPELVFPAGSLRELAAKGSIGALHPIVYGLMGHIDGRHLQTLRDVTAPEIARRLADAKVDYALLVPA